MISVPSWATLTLPCRVPGKKTFEESPSLVQKRIGVGFPAATHSNFAFALPFAVLANGKVTSSGRTRKTGGAETWTKQDSLYGLCVT